MHKIKLALIVILSFLITQTGFTQINKFWTKVTDSEIKTSGERQIIPQNYTAFKIDVDQLKSLLATAPMEFTAAVKNNPVILMLPMPDGSFERFKLFESPMVEEGLLQKYPNLRTWSGQGIETPSATAKMDFTKKGFHAMVLSPNGDWFIDPFSTGTIEYYISYFKKDLQSKRMFECGVHAEDEGLDKTNKHKKKDANVGNDVKKSAQSAGSSSARFGDCSLRTYRLALACTGEYAQFHGGTVADALAAQVTAMNRVNGIYERDFSLRMNIIANNNLVIYTNGATDPYTNNSGGTMLGENQSNLDAVIGTANYDIGHVFSTGGGGVANLNSPCSSTLKARGVTGLGSPIGDPFYIDYVAHEMGHQWGGRHTFNNCNGSGNTTSGVEVGSGITIQAYAGICGPTNVQSNSDAMFHAYSIEEMYGFITAGGNGCAVTTTTTNNFPNIVSSSPTQTIPHSTPFMLSCVATDADGDTLLTYSWEQMDAGSVVSAPPSSTSTSGPNFKTFLPSTDPARFFPRLQDLVNNVTPTWEVLPSVGRTMDFRLIVRDNNAGAGCNDHADLTLTVAGTAGPFNVTAPNTSTVVWTGFGLETVTWNVANTDVSPVNCPTVDILLSTDGGFTYPDTLATAVPNNGSANVTVPNIPTTTARVMVVGSGRAFFDISNDDFTINLGSTTLSCIPSSVDVLCNGGADGRTSVTVIGGTAPYNYLWSNGVTTANNNNIIAGTYSVTITDAVNDDTTCVVTVSEPTAISVSSTTTDATCGGASDGSAVLTVSGGTPITTLTTDTLFTEDFEDSLANGFTQVTNATDGGFLINDAASLSSAYFTIPSHTIIAATNDDGCDCDKSSEYFILPPINFDTYGSINMNCEIYFEGNTYQTNTETASIEVSTDSGATWTTNTILTGSGSWQNVNADLSAYSSINNVWVAFKYDDGTGWLYGLGVDDIVITAQPTSPVPYTYQWSNGETNSSATNLSAGTYTITISDANACTVIETLTINQQATINTTLSKSNVNCFGGSDGTATIAFSGGSPPYTISWNTNPVQTTNFISNLTAGFYTATVTDAVGCTKTGSVEVRLPDELVAFFIPTQPDTIGASTGSINLLVTGGISPYTHLWSNGATTEDLSNVPAGVYFCTTTDRNGCAILTTVMLTDPPPFAPYLHFKHAAVQNEFHIYPSPVNSNLFVIALNQVGSLPYSLDIFSIGGNLIHSYKLYNSTNQFDVSELDSGVYFIRIRNSADTVFFERFIKM